MKGSIPSLALPRKGWCKVLRKLCMITLIFAIFSMFCAAVFPQKNDEKIVFASDELGHSQIFLLDDKSRKPIQLTDIVASNEQPALSPDGKRVAFISRIGASSDLYVLDIESDTLEQLPGSGYGSPDWSPGGKRIACIHEGEVYIMNDSGRNLTRLTTLGAASHPHWSPNTASILFEWENVGIAIVDANSGQVTEIDTPGGNSYLPRWSSDGRQIAFMAQPTMPTVSIYVMDKNGENFRRLAYAPNQDFDPAWSPDGAKLAFIRMTGEQFDIYVMDTDGGNLRNITNSLEVDGQPDWSPDGSRLAFSSTDKILPNLFVMDADGGNRRKVLDGFYGYPNWLPDGRIGVLSYEDGNLYAVDPDGGAPELLVDRAGKSMVMFPSWSPDGKRVAYQTLEPNGFLGDLYVCDPDGQDERFIADIGSSTKGRFDWSPDGREIVISFRGNQVAALVHVVDVDSGEIVCLSNANDFSQQLSPAFSPDGSKIAFAGQEHTDRTDQIYVMDVDGSNLRSIGPIEPPLMASFRATGMTWSPDGSSILFSGLGVDGERVICEMDVKTGQSEEWYKNAEAPDWAKPRRISVDPYSKMLTSWGKIK